MDKEVKTRLRTLIAIKRVSNLEIAEKTDYTPGMVSKSLNPKYDVLTIKFLNRFFDGFPELKKDYRQWVVEGTGKSPVSISGGDNGLFDNTPELELLRKENAVLSAQISSMKKDLDRVWAMLEKAMQIHPDLSAKLLSPLAQNESMVLVDTPLGMLANSLGTKQGALA